MQIIAHRGASGSAPENSLSAIELALSFGVTAIEVDLQFSDGEIWVFHDRRLERCTNGQGVLTAQSAAYLRQLTLKPKGAIPTLDQLLACVRGRCTLHLELKSTHLVEPLGLALAHAEQHYGFTPDQWVISSFNHVLLHECQQRYPQWQYGALTASLPLDLAAFAQTLAADFVNVDADFVSPELIADAHQRGLGVLVYTVDDPDEVAQLEQLGVNGAFTNHPERFIKIPAAG